MSAPESAELGDGHGAPEAEEWADIPGWPHQASTLGQIRRKAWMDASGCVHLPRLLAQTTDKRRGKGYLYVTLRDGARRRKAAVHVLVLEAWRGPRPSPGYDGCHNDGIRTDNRLVKLRWDTREANQADRVTHARLRAVTPPVTTPAPDGPGRYKPQVSAPGAVSRRAVTRNAAHGTRRFCSIPSLLSVFLPARPRSIPLRIPSLTLRTPSTSPRAPSHPTRSRHPS